MSKKVIFHIEGGLGKNIAATSVIRSYKKVYSDSELIVVSAYPDVFQNNPNVLRSYQLGNAPYFYQDFILDKDVEIFAHDPYKTTSHITKKQHLIDTWCEMIGVENDKKTPDIFFNMREKEIARTLLPNTEKPIIIFQPFGGSQVQELPYSWTRDIHPLVAQQIVNRLADTYTIIHICHEHHPKLNNVVRIDKIVNKKILTALLSHTNKRILIDSSLQHAAAAMGLPSTVVWVATDPKLFGYNIHNNIMPMETFPNGGINSYLFDYNFTGTIQECPYASPNQIFNVEEIIKGL
jgi:ADP-heptose:LPS heptosyltransferase